MSDKGEGKMNTELSTPAIEAAKAFREGEGLSANPFQKGSANHSAFAWEMHKLQNREFEALRAQLRVGK
jgi:hypothetical protein